MSITFYDGLNVYNAPYPINFVCGNRSIGKSFNWKVRCVQQAIRRGKQFLYIRRNRLDIEASASKFWEDICIKFPGYQMETKIGKVLAEYWLIKETTVSTPNKYGEIVEEKTTERTLAGYGMCLDHAVRIKGIPLPNITLAMYDEFMPDNGKYLKPVDPLYEPRQLLSICDSVARGVGTPKREDFKLVCLSNLVSLYNPYFSYFGIDLTEQSSGKFMNGTVFAERVINAEVNAAAEKTLLGKLISQTEYGLYSMQNKALLDSKVNIERPTERTVPFAMIYFHSWYMLRQSSTQNVMYVCKEYDKTFKKRFKLTEISDKDDDGIDCAWFNSTDFSAVVRYLGREGKYRYATGAIKSVMAGILEPSRRVVQ